MEILGFHVLFNFNAYQGLTWEAMKPLPFRNSPNWPSQLNYMSSSRALRDANVKGKDTWSVFTCDKFVIVCIIFKIFNSGTNIMFFSIFNMWALLKLNNCSFWNHDFLFFLSKELERKVKKISEFHITEKKSSYELNTIVLLHIHTCTVLFH